jgi:hypothetical protein
LWHCGSKSPSGSYGVGLSAFSYNSGQGVLGVRSWRRSRCGKSLRDIMSPG